MYPSEFFGPTGPEASQAQGFTFLVRDQKLGIKVSSNQGPTALPKYLMRSRQVRYFGWGTMRFCSMSSVYGSSPYVISGGLYIFKIKKDIQCWQGEKATEFYDSCSFGKP